MRTLKVISELVLLLGICVSMSVSQKLTKAASSKLHPTFQSIVAKSFPESGLSASMIERQPSGLAKDGAPLFDAIISTKDPAAVRSLGVHVNSAFEGFVTAQLRPVDLVRLAELDTVSFIDPGTINYPHLDVSVPEIGVNLLHSGYLNNTIYKGKDVIVVIYDTGIDWKHLDFRNPGDTTKTRILSIWDQTLVPSGSERNPIGFSYGVEYTKSQIEDELDGTPANVVREKDTDGHGTHVAGIATGNGASYLNKYVGVAPEADVVVVKGGDLSFFESRIIDGLTYARNMAQLHGKPVVVNYSLGGQQGPHDGTRNYEVAINSFVNTPGRAVVISAGNDGDKSIHIGGNLSSTSSTTLSLNVPSYTPAAGTNNDQFVLDVWLDGDQSATATVTSPGGISYTRNSGETGTHSNSSDGTIELWNYTYSGNNSRNIYLNVRDATASAPRSGAWTLTISNVSGSVPFDGWLASRSVGNQTVALVEGNAAKTVSMPGTAQGAITVGSFVTKWSWPSWSGSNRLYSNSFDGTAGISGFSSIGPTRDGRQKPEIAAPGQGIVSSLSQDKDTTGWWRSIVPGNRDLLIQGTSQAAPHITGIAALLLSASPSLTAAQMKTLLAGSANSDVWTGAVPNDTWGYGKVDALRTVARLINSSAAVQRAVHAYDAGSTNVVFSPFLTGSIKYAVRFTPTISGQVTGMQLNVTTTNNAPIIGAGPLVCEVFSNTAGSVGGIPGTKLGISVMHPFDRLSTGTNNFIDLASAGVDVVSGQDYHLVISVANPQDVIKIRSDDGSSPSSRSSVFNAGRWANLQDPASGQSTARNFRMRVVVTSVTGLVSVERIGDMPSRFELSQNFPNPFNPSTTIRYSIPEKAMVKLKIYDLIGREVATLVNQELAAGTYSVEWNGTDNIGSRVSSGVYFYRLESARYHQTQKMILIQ